MSGDHSEKDLSLNGDGTTLNQILSLLVSHSIHPRNTPTSNFQIMPDLAHTVGNFDGEVGQEQLASEWLQNLNATADLHQWPTAVKLQVARRHLIGAAHKWYLSCIEVIFDWPSFETPFKQTFTKDLIIAQKYQRMQERIQLKTESVQMYFHSKVRLCHALSLEFLDVMEQVLLGLSSRFLANTLLVARHMDEDDLLRDINAYERIDKVRADNFPTECASWKSQNRRPLLNKTSLNTQRAREDTASPAKAPVFTRAREDKHIISKSNFQCWNCQAFGHLLRDCPESSRRKFTQKVTGGAP